MDKHESYQNLHQGLIAGISGPVVDVTFKKGELPKIREELFVFRGEEKRIMEVAQHLSDRLVRCIMPGASEGLHRDMTVYASGSPIRVPVGEAVLGRLFDALGNTIDGESPIPDEVPHESIYRPAPAYSERKNTEEILETGIKGACSARWTCSPKSGTDTS